MILLALGLQREQAHRLSFQTGASYLTVTYRNDFGLESYYTYQTQSAAAPVPAIFRPHAAPDLSPCAAALVG